MGFILEMVSNNASAFNTIKNSPDFWCRHFSIITLARFLSVLSVSDVSMYVRSLCAVEWNSKYEENMFVIVSETRQTFFGHSEFRCKVNIIMIWESERKKLIFLFSNKVEEKSIHELRVGGRSDGLSGNGKDIRFIRQALDIQLWLFHAIFCISLALCQLFANSLDTLSIRLF